MAIGSIQRLTFPATGVPELNDLSRSPELDFRCNGKPMDIIYGVPDGAGNHDLQTNLSQVHFGFCQDFTTGTVNSNAVKPTGNGTVAIVNTATTNPHIFVILGEKNPTNYP
jgi:hypothetical protein